MVAKPSVNTQSRDPDVNRLTVVTYHSLDSTRSPISVEPGVFAEHVEWFAGHGFTSLTLSEGLAGLRAGRLPRKALALTFDDGFLTTATVGLPTLSAHGMKATVFLVSKYVGRHNDFPTQPAHVPRLPLMDWTAVEELASAGWELGAHTSTHPDLTRLPRQQAQAELYESKAVIEQRLGVRVQALAYPYGRQGPREREMVSRAYESAVATRLGLAGASSDQFALERVDGYYLSRPNLVSLVGGPLLPPYLRLRQVIRDMRGLS